MTERGDLPIPDGYLEQKEIVRIYDGSRSPNRYLLRNLFNMLCGKYYIVDRENVGPTPQSCELQFFAEISTLEEPIYTYETNKFLSSSQLDRIIDTCVQYLNDELIFVSRDKGGRYQRLEQKRTQENYNLTTREAAELQLEKDIAHILNS